MKRIFPILLCGLMSLGVEAATEQHDEHEDHESEAHEEHEGHDETGLRLSPEQITTAGVVVEVLTPGPLPETLRAPGEILRNAYATAQVTPRISAQVIERHARLGDHVDAGDPLVTLSSVEMATAQGDLLVAHREWRRVQQLGKAAVSGRRYTEAQVADQQAHARLLAYGMTTGQSDALLKGGAKRADGSFRLLAPRDGTVISDDFLQGELVEPGGVLFVISDESSLWVDARVSPEEISKVTPGMPARVQAMNHWLDARVRRIQHQPDETTRTLGVRIELPNPGHPLHPGQFVEVEIMLGEGEPVLALPETAVLRGPDGDWQVFITGDGEGAFQSVEVELMRTAGGLAIIHGLPEGATVVTHGAFFLQSEQAKSGFDIHQH